jgi:hypothetical protein
VSGHHMPFPSIGYVERTAQSYRWTPATYQLWMSDNTFCQYFQWTIFVTMRRAIGATINTEGKAISQLEYHA